MTVTLLFLLMGLVGLGASRLLGTRRAGAMDRISFAILVGMPTSTVIVLMLDLMGIPLRTSTILLGLVVAAALLALPGRRLRDTDVVSTARRSSPAEAVVLVVIGYLLVLAMWQDVRHPVMARDAIVGMDLVARYAVEDETVRSRVFTDPALDGYRSNQPYYAPLTALMQTAVRAMGRPFGKLWLPLLTAAFAVALHLRLRARCHPVIAGGLVLLLLGAPSFYTLSWAVLTDLPNAIFFGMSALLAHEYAREGRRRALVASGVFLGFACWTRADTIVFVPFLALLVMSVGPHRPPRTRAADGAIFSAPAIALVALWQGLYVGLLLPGGPTSALGETRSLADLTAAVTDMARLLTATELYGLVFHLLAVGLIANLVFRRARRGADLLGWLAVVGIGFVVLLALSPATTVAYTVKRGMLKALPIAVVYLAGTEIVQRLSARLDRWERGSRVSESPRVRSGER